MITLCLAPDGGAGRANRYCAGTAEVSAAINGFEKCCIRDYESGDAAGILFTDLVHPVGLVEYSCREISCTVIVDGIK